MSTEHDFETNERHRVIHGWELERDIYSWACSCGWAHKISRKTIVENQEVLEMGRLLAIGHAKDAHDE